MGLASSSFTTTLTLSARSSSMLPTHSMSLSRAMCCRCSALSIRDVLLVCASSGLWLKDLRKRFESGCARRKFPDPGKVEFKLVLLVTLRLKLWDLIVEAAVEPALIPLLMASLILRTTSRFSAAVLKEDVIVIKQETEVHEGNSNHFT